MSSFYHCLAEDEFGFIWFGSRHGGGLYRYDGYDLRSFVVDPSRLHASLTSNEVNTVFGYGDGMLHIGTHGGMTVLDLVTGNMRCYADDISKVPDYTAFLIQPIIPDSARGCTWIGSAYGLCRWIWSTDAIECRPPADGPGKVPAPRNIVDIIMDKRAEHILWIGAANGLFRYDKDNGDYTRLPIPAAREMSILDLHEDPAGDIWIAGDEGVEKHTGRLFRYTPRTDSFKAYPLALNGSRTGREVGEVFAVLPASDADKLWLSTKTSVGILDTRTGTYAAWTFDPDRPDGLLPNEFFRAMLADRHGRLWVSSWQGVQYAKTAFADRARPHSAPRVAITDVRVSNARADMDDPLLYTQPLHLRQDQRAVSIRYVLPNPLQTNNVVYQYQLEGWDKDWTTSDQRLVRYSRLRGGRYTFHVRGREGPGEWGETTSLPISIEYRIFEYPVFWLLAATLIGAMIIGTNRYLIARTRKEERIRSEFDKKVSGIEMQALRAQMNPHFLFNSLNAIKYYALHKDKEATADYITKFSLLVRTILTNSRVHTISVKEEVEALRLYIEIEHLRLEGKFDYHIEVDRSIRVEEAQMPPLILQPFVENAIWHGLMHMPSGGRLLVQVKDMGAQIQCIIEDNGIGRARAGAIRHQGAGHKQSMGLRITGDRIALINRIYGIDTQVHIIDLVNHIGEAVGTRVVIHIPLIQEFET